MGTATVTELNQQTRRVLARVAHGEEMDITDRGRVVAKLIAMEPDPLSALIGSGKLHPATCEFPLATWKGLARQHEPVNTDHESGALLREMRT